MAEKTAEQQHKDNLAAAKAALERGVNVKALPPAQLKAIEDEYQYAVEVITSDKNLMQLFTAAVRGQWTDQKFALEAKSNKWFVERDSSQEWYQLRALDPDNKLELERTRESIEIQVKNYVVQNLGLNPESADVAAKITEVSQFILQNRTQANNGNWQIEIPNLVGAKFADLKPSDFGGAIADNVSTLYGTARGLGLQMNDQQLSTYVSDIVKGNSTLENVQNTLRKQAAGMWTQFSDRIMGGESLSNILYPYTQMIGSMLELDADALDFTVEDPNAPAGKQIDPLLQSALFSSADGKNVMSLTDLRKAIKKDSRWQYTKNAQDEYASLTKSLMRMFGAGV